MAQKVTFQSLFRGKRAPLALLLGALLAHCTSGTIGPAGELPVASGDGDVNGGNSDPISAPDGGTMATPPPMRTDCETFEGDVTAVDEGDLAPYLEHCVITGDLVLQQSNLQTLNLPELVAIGGDLRIDDNLALTSVALPALDTVAGAVQLRGNSVLSTLTLDRLAQVRNGCAVTHNPMLTSLQAPLLSTVDEPLLILRNDALERIDLPQLVSVAGLGNLYIQRNARLTSVDLSGLQRTSGRLWVTNNDTLPTLQLDALQEATESLQVAFNQGLTGVTANALSTTDELLVTGNQTLSGLQVANLQTTQRIAIKDNPALTNCTLGAGAGAATGEMPDACR